ncbi:ATP-binding protein [Thalassotalea sp. ND16A]|uniref:ATP-binding protein n=1 Tax=Thalassotalea sp. ND16A TaxID=1535422 RepID=UPI000519EEBA|nr:ATP-binding protein [Thalassotalea sp. ND16A]KGK00398.1 hypothetical protein ND16A_3605 [Thalassotalea sp. ND16A]
MANHFLKLYFFLLLTVAGTAWTVDSIYLYFQQEHQLEEHNQLQENYRPLLEHYAIQSEMQSTTEQLKLPENVSVVSKKALAWPLTMMAKLNSGKIVLLTDSVGHSTYYLATKNESNVVMLTLENRQADNDQYAIYWMWLFYSAIGIVVYLWIYPLVKDVYRLQKAAIRLGQGKQYQAIELGKNSMLAPTGNAFNEMANRIGNLLGLQQDINSAVSHDIRTPLARIKFTLATCEQANLTQSKQSIIEDINEIDDLVSEILLYAKFEHTHPLLEIHHQDLSRLTNDIIAKYRQMSSITFHLDIEPGFAARYDHRSFTRVLQNLLDNSIRFARQHIHISIRREDDHNILTLEDDGPGIPTELLNSITKPFVGSAEKEKASAGFGLGLFIVEKICVWHNGQFKVDNFSRYGGAKFEIIWPVDVEKPSY